MEKNDRLGPDFPENRPPSESYRPYQPPVFPAGYPAYPSGAPSTARAEEEPPVPGGGPQYQPASNQQGQAPFSQAGCPPHPFGGGPAPHPNTGPSRSAPALQAGPAAPSGPAAPPPSSQGWDTEYSSPQSPQGPPPSARAQKSAPSQAARPPYIPRKATKVYQDTLAAAQRPKTLVLLVLVLLFGVLYTETVLRAGLGLSVPLTVGIFCGISVWYGKSAGTALYKPAMFLLLPIAVIALSFLFIDSAVTHFVNMCALFVLVPIQVTAMARVHTADLFSVESAKRAFVEVFCRPFSNLDMPFLALCQKRKGDSKKSRAALGIILGLLVALPVGLLFLALFSSADANFSGLIVNTLRLFSLNLRSVFFDLFFGFFIALFCAAMLIGLKGRRKEDAAPKGLGLPERRGGLPAAAVGSFLTVIVLIHALFVGVQFQYLFGGANGLPDHLTYAQYARWGYMELAFALLIALILVAVALYVTKRRENGRLPIYIGIALTLLILCDFVVLASSIYRMLLYMQVYNLTVTRVMVLWSIILMGLCMLWLLGRVWFPRFKALRWCAVTVVAMVILLNAANIDVLTAKINVDRYLAGQTQEIDCRYLSTLSSAAAPEVERLLQSDASRDARRALQVYSYKLEQKNWRNFAVPDLEARKVIERNNIFSVRYYYEGSAAFEDANGTYTGEI